MLLIELNIMKITIIIWAIFYTSIAFITNSAANTEVEKTTSKTAMDIIDPPQISALNIILGTLSSLKELKKHNQATIENVRTLIKIKLLSNVDISTATELSLKQHWNKLNPSQKSIFQQYIIQSLIKDYVNIFIAYDKLDELHITVNPKVKRQNNRAIVNLTVRINNNVKPMILTLKMIQNNQWRIYDVAFSGVSLIKNYRAQFNSHIRRKGLESLIVKIAEKIK